MITVFKYVIHPHESTLLLPNGAEALSVGFQHDTLCMWVKVNTDNNTTARNFEAFGTGHEIPYNMGVDYKFVGTAHTGNGLVFHAFERLGL